MTHTVSKEFIDGTMKKQTTVDIYKIYFEMGIEDIWQLFEIEASCSVLHV